jgi:glycine betaine/proline transport system substrate-binding protein
VGLVAYKLRNTLTHNQGEYQAMIADVIACYTNGLPVLYYTWTAYWVSGPLVPGKDVESLSMPFTALPDGATANTEFNGKNLGFAVEEMGIIARNDFLQANPAAAKLFEVATLDINDTP